jgi:hypothetical protein
LLAPKQWSGAPAQFGGALTLVVQNFGGWCASGDVFDHGAPTAGAGLASISSPHMTVSRSGIWSATTHPGIAALKVLPGDPTITPRSRPRYRLADSCAALVICISTDFSEPEIEVWNYPRTIASPEISMEADSRPAAAIVDAQAGGVPCCGCRLRENQNDPGLADTGWSLSAMVPGRTAFSTPQHI